MRIPWFFRSSKAPKYSSIPNAALARDDRIETKDVPFTLYLNQRLTFDVLASLEDGFSYLSTVQTQSARASSTERAMEAEFGASNALMLLGVKLGGRGYKHTDQAQDESTTMQKVHTTASLFARLRGDLLNRGLLRELSDPLNLGAVKPGDFVEFEATLRRVPLVEMLSALSQLMPLIELAGQANDPTTKRTAQGKRGNRSQPTQVQDGTTAMRQQVELFQSAVTAEGSEDLIAEVGETRVVLTTELKYFIDPSMNDTIDGTFRVIGKVTRIITDETDGISFLRKTPLGKFSDVIGPLGSVMADTQGPGFSGPIETEISGPTMQVFPIAIYL